MADDLSIGQGAFHLSVEDREFISNLIRCQRESEQTCNEIAQIEPIAEKSLTKAGNAAGATAAKFLTLASGAAGAAKMVFRYGAAFFQFGDELARATEQTTQNLETQFGEAAVEVGNQMSELGDRLHFTGQSMQALAVDASAVARSLGIGGEAGVEFSNTLATLAAELGRIHGENPADVMKNLEAAMGGSASAVSKYGVDLNEANTNQLLLNMGIEGGIEAASEEQKALANLQQVLSQTSESSAQADEAAQGYAGQMDKLQANVTELANKVFALFVPALTELSGWLADLVGKIDLNSERMVYWQEVGVGAINLIKDAWNGWATAITNADLIWDTLVLSTEETFTNIADRIKWAFENAWTFVTWFYDNFEEIAQVAAHNYIQVWKNIGENIVSVMTEAWDFISSGGTDAFDPTLKSMTEGLKQVTTQPEWKQFVGTDFSEQWKQNEAEWKNRLKPMADAAKETGKEMKKELDLETIARGLGGDGAKNKKKKEKVEKDAAEKIQVELVGSEQLFRKNLLDVFKAEDKKNEKLEKLAAEQLAATKDQTAKLVIALEDQSAIGA